MRNRVAAVAAVLLVGLAGLTACGDGKPETRPIDAMFARVPKSIQLTSPAFPPGGPIPERFSCEGENVPPPLAWTGVPPEAKVLALVVDDLSKPVTTDTLEHHFFHWVVFNIPPTVTGIDPAQGTPPGLPAGAGMATSSSQDGDAAKYIGPCPPNGDPPHRYRFTLYALPGPVQGVGSGPTVIPGLVIVAGIGAKTVPLARGELIGTFAR